jgi:hypothetical protein
VKTELELLKVQHRENTYLKINLSYASGSMLLGYCKDCFDDLFCGGEFMHGPITWR